MDWRDHVLVDDLGYVIGLVADRIADVPDRDVVPIMIDVHGHRVPSEDVLCSLAVVDAT
jgi:hypothetical protein